jgi:hypothetical protein
MGSKKYDKQYLYNAYNATSTDDGHGDIETYENWLERQLISRMKTIDEFNSEEAITDRNTKVVSSFMEHCKNEWSKIPEKMFETYFNA